MSQLPWDYRPGPRDPRYQSEPAYERSLYSRLHELWIRINKALGWPLWGIAALTDLMVVSWATGTATGAAVRVVWKRFWHWVWYMPPKYPI